MPRHELPNRREQRTQRVTWSAEEGGWEAKAYVSAGFDPRSGILYEVFIRGAGKSGSERDFMLDDIAVVISRALQFGDTARSLAAGMGRTPEGKPTSLIGAVLDAVVDIEAEYIGELPPKPPEPDNIIRMTGPDRGLVAEPRAEPSEDAGLRS